MLWLEADRMGWLLPTMDSAKVDLQRDVVKNERRESYENQPYGLASETILRMLYPPGHPYSWPVIGSMQDLSAASLQDVIEFFQRYYAPNNAVIVVAGDVQADSVIRLVRDLFGDIPRGPEIQRPVAPAFDLTRDTMAVLEDRVQLPRLYYAWHTVKGYAPDDAALEEVAYILTGAKNSRLTQALVYEDQVATNAFAYQDGMPLDGEFQISATARPGVALPVLQGVIDAQLARLAEDGPTPRELDQAKNAIESSFLGRIESVSGKASQLNSYYYWTGQPDYFARDIARYRAVTADDIRRVVRTYLLGPRVVLSVVPQGQPELAALPRGVSP